jgi:hypothetical protein
VKDEEAKAAKEKAAKPKAKPKAKGRSKDKEAIAAEQKQRAEAKAAKKKEKEAKAAKPKISKVKSGTLQEDWPVTFWLINNHLPEEDRIYSYPQYKLCNHITISEITLATLMFVNAKERIMKDANEIEEENLKSNISKYKTEMCINSSKHTLNSKGTLIKEVVADLSTSRNIRKKLDLSLEDRNYAELTAISTNGFSLTVIWRQPNKRAIGYDEGKSMVRPYDLVNILDQKTNTEAFSKQQLRDMEQFQSVKKSEELDITWTGLDSGERYALAYSSLLSDSNVAFGTYSRDAYYNSIHKPTTDYINSQKPEDIKNQERQLSENPSDSNLFYNNALYSRAYYGSSK